MVNREEVDKIGHLARINLSDDEKESLAADLNNILEYFSMLEGLDTADVPPTNNVLEQTIPFREDETHESFHVDEVRKLAPEFATGHIVVPRVI